MRYPLLTALVALTLAGSATAQPPVQRSPGIVRVRLNTSEGAIMLAIETRRAPATSANFLAYVDDHRFDGAQLYRSARQKNAPTFGFIQGGIRSDAQRILPPFPLERTDRTGVHHVDGAISMARRAGPDSAGGNFFIAVGPLPSMDAKGKFDGYAAFGHVIAGMDVVRRVLAKQTGGRMGGQMLLKPVTLIKATRLDGVAKPTGFVKPWLVVPHPVRRPAPPKKR